ncbi:TPA: hypothetical protein QDC27_001718 [Burkholderia cepacia ATCC 25416]|uniref:hypothetical protein n=1 Tax=Burkholderia cepacia TaxID=292 RepID=UPI0011AFDB55|nr:hypothetical protein [Burkholderia cepacia]HDR9766787.1 hypothetical protein [Burkholderia cepacia ATCC 25416]KAB1590258.1 hypothetical protein C5O75_018715 [Burkholderia cepacia]MCA8322932.1 hypothetical protein [Burkholderia cepacia]HDR9773966.1 hypothetical protein [Burkholderia cepacia ATCC 25416]HDR9782998.1 hypothetical protein [Burkholderia cepacia ATCC 25416]
MRPSATRGAWFPLSLPDGYMQPKAWVIAVATAVAALSAHAQQADGVAPATAQDEIVNYQAVGNAAGVTKIYRSIRTTDPTDARRTVVVEQVLKQIAPGRVSFVRGEQPAEATRHRQQQCAQRGAVDVTDESDVTIDERVLDFALCRSTAPMPAGVARAAKAGGTAPAKAIANDQGITIIVPGILAHVFQFTDLPVHLWVSTAQIGNVPMSLYSEPFGVVNFTGYTNGGVVLFQPVFSVRAVKLGEFAINARACGPGIGCFDDSRGRINVVR